MTPTLDPFLAYCAYGNGGAQTFNRSTGYITECSYNNRQNLDVQLGSRNCVKHTAIPAKAPASMLADSEKFGGSAS
jgi:hypothetical protein